MNINFIAVLERGTEGAYSVSSCALVEQVVEWSMSTVCACAFCTASMHRTSKTSPHQTNIHHRTYIHVHHRTYIHRPRHSHLKERAECRSYKASTATRSS